MRTITTAVFMTAVLLCAPLLGGCAEYDRAYERAYENAWNAEMARHGVSYPSPVKPPPPLPYATGSTYHTISILW